MTTLVTPAEALRAQYDLIVVGAGITGAGIVHRAVHSGLSVLLVDQGDFASGTSSASSKLVHGGLRYLAHGHWRLTYESVRERDRLLLQRPALVQRLRFLMPVYAGARPGLAALRSGLAIYDLMGGHWRSRRLTAEAALALQPGLRTADLRGAVQYDDASTDDCRLVLQLIHEARHAGAHALHYTVVDAVLAAAGRVCGVMLRDIETGVSQEIHGRVVVNATGTAADRLRPPPSVAAPPAPALRPLRGSHLLLPLQRLSLAAHAVGWLHPRDGRPIFVYPWLGAALLGTTDVDHPDPTQPAVISVAETDYLLEGLTAQFPALQLGIGDVIASYAGLRPVVHGGKADPSAESRESALWSAPGWIGVTGGKLTTFGVTARQVLTAVARQCPGLDVPRRPRLAPLPPVPSHALGAPGLTIAGTPYHLGDIDAALRDEGVRHLDDLLLRRTRLGLLLAGGAAACLPTLLPRCQALLGWDAARCDAEVRRYQQLWRAHHAPVPG